MLLLKLPEWLGSAMNNKHDENYCLESGVVRLQDGAEAFFDRIGKQGSVSHNKYFAFLEAVLDVVIDQPLLAMVTTILSGVVIGTFLRRLM